METNTTTYTASSAPFVIGRPTRRWPYIIDATAWRSYRTACEADGFSDIMRNTTQRNLAKYAAGRAMFCPSCGACMDQSRTVVYRSRTVCTACFTDALASSVDKADPETLLRGLWAEYLAGDIIDGGALWTCSGRPRREPAPPSFLRSVALWNALSQGNPED